MGDGLGQQADGNKAGDELELQAGINGLGRQTGGACCRPLAVTPMYHKGLVGWRYDCKSNYMITLVTEPRCNLFGTLQEWGVERSEAGKAVYDSWQEIEAAFPGVRATYNSIMPDHFHGIVYVTFDGAADLDAVVRHFAALVERRLGRRVWCALYRDSVCLARGQLHRQIAYVLSNAKRRWVKENNPGLFRKTLGFRHWRLDRANEACSRVGDADEWNYRDYVARPDAECWYLESGEAVVGPRKANRRQRVFGDGAPEQQADDSKAGGRAEQQADDSKVGGGKELEWAALGNPFLLDSPMLVSVRISTKTPPDELARLVERLRMKAARGAVIVSPFISPGEKAVKTVALETGGSVVQLLSEGMGRYYKPAGRDFDVCAEGRMLQLSPFRPREAGVAEREHYGKARFEWLNMAAQSLADGAIGWSRASGATAIEQQQGRGAR